MASGEIHRSLHVVTGCSGVGKTDWALRWAAEHGAEIVSCDSLLFYRGMDIGTAKPSAEERARVPHHLIDIRGVAEPVDITQYVALARAAVEGIAARERPVMVVGGSGFYLKAFFGPVADDVAVSPELRGKVAARLAAEGLPALVEELRRLNPEGLGPLDTANPRRVTRALERCLASGETLGRLAASFAAQPGPFSGWNVELTELVRDPAELESRIAGRTRDMLARGLMREVEGLLAEGLRANPSASRAIGYREVIEFLGDGLPGDRLESEIVKNTRALVKKQRTWFRTQLPAARTVVRLNPG